MAPPQWAYQLENFVNKPDEELVCSICRAVFCDPVTCPCDHVFCQGCISKWLKDNVNCPICRKRASNSSIKQVPIIKNLILKLQLSCHNKSVGCKAQFSVDSSEAHVKECEYELVQCRNKPCKDRLFRKDIVEHETSNCPHFYVKCKVCGSKMPISAVKEKYNSIRSSQPGLKNSNSDEEVSSCSDEESVFYPTLKYFDDSDSSFLSELEKYFKEPVEIPNTGKYELSTTENGESIIFYEPDVLGHVEGSDYFDLLYKNTNWQKKKRQPRLVAWYGPYPYAYSGVTLDAAAMPDEVLEIKKRVEQYLEAFDIEVTFNSVLLNLYRDGKDSVAWHSDGGGSSLGIIPTIANVSLGETRNFEMRRKNDLYENLYERIDKYFVELTHGSLLVMTGCMQKDWQHRVPKEKDYRDARISLSFRKVYPLEKVPQRVPAKETVNEYSQIDLEDLIHFEISIIPGKKLQAFAYTLRNKVLERLQDFRPSDQEELEFFCNLTDGTQSETNQRRISIKLCNYVNNCLCPPSTSRKWTNYDGNSRPRGYGNQSNASGRGRKRQNQGRSNKYRY